jgi:hypothetical protein
MASIKQDIFNKTARHTNIQLWIPRRAEKTAVSKMVSHEMSQLLKVIIEPICMMRLKGLRKLTSIRLIFQHF